MSESPRVVCTKCPAVAKVHYWIAPEFNNGEAEIWMECHGEHVFGSVMPGIRQKTGEPLEFLFSQVRAHSIEYVNDMFERAERAMQKEAERAKLLQRFMRREPPT